jgi:hypothetical protein
MPDNISLEAKEIINESIKAFTNLLKEFPKTISGGFVYDESTLKKIENVGEALSGMASLGETENAVIKESFKILSQLMAELPRDSTDEFLYDHETHRQVEKARDTIAKLSRIIN